MKEEIKAGIIIIASLIILSTFIILIGGGQFVEKYDKYYVTVMNAAGLEVGSQVKLGGVRVGRVLNISPPTKAGEPVSIEIGIKKGTAIYKGTTALITQVGFVGDIYMLLSVQKTTNELHRPGDIITSEEQVQFSNLMAKIDMLSQSLDILLKDINKVFSDKNVKGIETLVSNTNNAIVSGTSNLEKITISLKTTTDKLERVLNEIEVFISGNKGEVSQLIKKAKEDVEKAGTMIESIEATAKSVEKASRTTDRVINSQSRNLENLIKTMTITTEDLHDLIQELRNKPWSIIYKGKEGE